MQVNQQDPRRHILFTRSGVGDKPHRMFTESNLRELKEMGQTEERHFREERQCRSSYIKSMKRFMEEPAELSALESGVAVTDFIEDIYCSCCSAQTEEYPDSSCEG